MRKPRVFLSYRRDDSSHQVGRIYDFLEREFGRANIFKDVDSIPAGSDFRAVIDGAVADTDVFLAALGDHWLGINAQGKRRIDNPDDFVRLELEAALSRGIPILPLLVGSSSMPSPDALPSALRAIAFRNAIQVRPDPDFRRDMDRLVKEVRNAADSSPRAIEQLRASRTRALRIAAASAVCATAAIAACAVLAARDWGRARTPPASPMFEIQTVELPKVGPYESLEITVYRPGASATTQTRPVLRTVDGKTTTVNLTESIPVQTQIPGTWQLPNNCAVTVYKPLSPRLPYLVVAVPENDAFTSYYVSTSSPHFRKPPSLEIEPPKPTGDAPATPSSDPSNAESDPPKPGCDR